jgi:enterochelin esterase family protein
MPLVGLAMMVAIAALAYGENSDDVQNPLIGTWELTSHWQKEDSKGKQVVTVNADLTGTVKDVREGWKTELRNVELNGDALSFSFFFEDTKDYEVNFKGTVVGKEIKGEFTIFGAKTTVAGVPLSVEEVAQIAARPSIFDVYEARSFTGSKNYTLQYRLFIPENYDPKKKYPLVLFHHGGGGTGDNNKRNLEGACIREWILPEAQANNPCFIVAPQFPGKESKSVQDGTFSMRGHIQTIHEVLDSLEKEFSIDTNREYVTGLSFGGECTWMSLVERPDRFAAAVPICATVVYTGLTVAERTEQVAQLPLWIFHGDADEVVPVEASRKIVKALRDSGGNPKYTEYPGVNHYSWDLAYRDPELVEWLFAQKRRSNSPGASGTEYRLGVDSLPQEGVPKGTVEKRTWNDSSIYPGTTHDYWVYVPAQYDEAKPACVMVFQDGGAYVATKGAKGAVRVPTVFDNLIHRGEIPVTIGIFIDPWTKDSGSSNREDAYVPLNDTYARFLLEEILPEVGKDYNLVDNAAGRAVCGMSDGGLCSFTVVWECPDAFSKAISHVGSYTRLRGGSEYPYLIRKTRGNPKPIRVFLQDGENDINITQGNWTLANINMASALMFSRYDYRFEMGTGGHDTYHGGVIFPDTLRWIWRDYPGVKGAGDAPDLDAVIGQWDVTTNTLGQVTHSVLTVTEQGGVLSATLTDEKDGEIEVTSISFEDGILSYEYRPPQSVWSTESKDKEDWSEKDKEEWSEKDKWAKSKESEDKELKDKKSKGKGSTDSMITWLKVTGNTFKGAVAPGEKDIDYSVKGRKKGAGPS